MLTNLQTARKLLDICERDFDGSPVRFAEALGMSYQNLKQYLNGRSKPGNILRERLSRLGIFLEDEIIGSPKNRPVAEDFGKTQYPVVSSIYAGNGETKTTFEYESKVMLPGPSGRKYIGSLYFKVKGDSMEPKWEAGDYVLVNPNLKPKDGEYAVVGFNSSEGSIKKIFIREKKIILKSLNPDYPDEMIDKENIWFLGKVVSTLHR